MTGTTGGQWQPRHDGEHLSDEILSAYLDGQLEDEAQEQAVRDHLASCDACRQDLAELGALVTVLAELREPALPRSFRLTPAMVPARVPPPQPWLIRFQPALHRLAAIAALLLVAVLGADLVVHRLGGESTPVAVQSAPAALSDSAGTRESTSITSAGAASGGSSGATVPTPAAAATSPAAGMAAAASPAAAAPATVAPAAAPGRALSESQPPVSTPTATPAATPEALGAGSPPGAASNTSSQTGSSSLWRVAEVAIAVALVWLLVIGYGLPQLGRQRAAVVLAEPKEVQDDR